MDIDATNVEAATLLADAWGPALNRSYRIGWEDGWRLGYAQAEKDMADDWHQMWADTQAVLAQPTITELKRRRGAT